LSLLAWTKASYSHFIIPLLKTGSRDFHVDFFATFCLNHSESESESESDMLRN
jgi:hypothetical protein